MKLFPVGCKIDRVWNRVQIFIQTAVTTKINFCCCELSMTLAIIVSRRDYQRHEAFRRHV